jgi:hypothetical protein
MLTASSISGCVRGVGVVVALLSGRAGLSVVAAFGGDGVIRQLFITPPPERFQKMMSAIWRRTLLEVFLGDWGRRLRGGDHRPFGIRIQPWPFSSRPMRTSAACRHTIAATKRCLYHISMGVALAVATGLSLAVAVLIALVVWRKRRDRYSTPEARYLRDVRGIQMDTYQQVKGPGHTPQVGDPPGYVGGTGPPVGF